MAQDDRLNAFNKIIAKLPMEDLIEMSSDITWIRQSLRPKDPKGGRPTTNKFVGRCTAWLVEDIHMRLKERKIKDPQNMAFKVIARHYFKASPHALKRHYQKWKHVERSPRFNAFMEHARWSDSHLELLLKLVQNS